MMGIFDFLKGTSKEKKRGVKKISLDEAGQLIHLFRDKINKEANLSLKETKEKINQEKDSVEDNIKKLEEAGFDSKAFPERVIPMMRDNRRTYIQRIRMFLKEIDLPDHVDEILEKCINLEYSMDEFGKNTTRNHHILQQYFGEKVSSLGENMVRIHKFIKEAEKHAKNPEIVKANELKNEFKIIQEWIKEKEEMKEKIKLEKEEQQKINKRITEVERKIKEREEGTRYGHLVMLLDKKKDIERDIREVEKEPIHSFSAINDALKKYERITMENRLVKKYLENPLKMLEEDKELKIVEIISKMKEAVGEYKIEIKKEKKDKIIQECDKITKDYLESFLGKLSELNNKLDELNSEIMDETIIKEIEELQEELRKEKTKEDGVKHKIGKMTRAMEEIDVVGLEKELEANINKKMDETVKIMS